MIASVETLEELRSLVSVAENRRTETGIPRVAMVRGKVPEHELSAVYEPMVNVIVQGSKTMSIGERALRYDPATYFVMTVDLPAVGTVHQGAGGEPYLAVSLSLEPSVVAEVLESAPPRARAKAGFAVAAMTPELVDAWTRLLRLMRRPEEITTLSPLYEREILYRVLQGPQGHLLYTIGMPDSAAGQIRSAIAWIRKHYARHLPITSLAKRAGMSESAFHRHFREVTSMSPLAFQKRLRLLQARTLLLESHATASSVALEVGYESASQFTREYARFFGLPPASDARRIREATSARDGER